MNETEQDQLAEFATSALRRNQPGSYEQTLAQHLITAVAADPITKIRLICEAALMTEDLGEEEKDKVYDLYTVALSFDQTKINIMLDAVSYKQADWHGVIAWSFPKNKECFERYIKPWVGSSAGLYLKPRSQKEEDTENMKPHEYFYYLTTRAHNSTLETLKARFTRYCMAYVMKLNADLCHKISPDTYTELLSKVRQ